MWSVPKYYKLGTKLVEGFSRVEAGSNTSTVTLRVVGGDEKGSLQFQETRTRERLRWQGPATYTKTDPSSRQRGRPTKTRP
jgi:hypothetical protein